MGVAHKEIAERAHEYDTAIANFKQEKVVTEMDIKEEQQNEKDMLQGEWIMSWEIAQATPRVSGLDIPP